MARYPYLTKPQPGIKTNTLDALTQGLILAYLFNEGSGRPTDTIHALTFTPNSGDFAWGGREGASGGPLMEVVGGGWGSAADSVLPVGGAPFSLVVRLYVIGNGGGAVFSYGTSGTIGAMRSLDFPTDTSLRFVGWGADDTATIANATNRWCWFGVSYDGTNLRIYEDGKLVKGPTALSLNTILNGAFLLGKTSFAGNVVNGQYDYLYVWNRALGDEEFLRVYQRPFSMFGRPQAPTLFVEAAGAETIILGGIGPMITMTDGPTVIGEEAIALLGIGPMISMGTGPTLSGGDVVINLLGIGPMIQMTDGPRVAQIDIALGGIGPMITMADGPTVTTAPKWLFPGGIGPMIQCGPPTVTGGYDNLVVFVAGVNRTRWLRVGAQRLDSQTRGRWTGSIEFEHVPSGRSDYWETDLAWTPSVGMLVLITEFGRILFRGCITEVRTERRLGTDSFMNVCRIQDKSAILERRVSKKAYEAEEDIADIIRDIHASVLSAPNEGIALSPDLPATLGAIGVRIAAMVYVSQVFDQIADVSGLQWWVDLTQVLHFTDPDDAAAAPISITETSENWRFMSADTSLRDYRNKEYVVSNRLILPGDGSGSGVDSGARTESFTLLDAGGGIGYQQLARDRGLPDGYIAVEFPIGSVVQVSVDAVVFDAYENSSQAFADFLNETAFLEQAFYYFQHVAFVVPILALSAGDAVIVKYIPAINNAAVDSGDILVVEEPDEPAAGEVFGTCGSGLYEHIEQVNNVSTQNELQAVAEGFIARSGVVPRTVRFETDHPGLEVGQKLSVNIPKHNLSSLSMFITGLSGQAQQVYDLGHESTFRWSVEASTGINPNWAKWWQRFWRRTQHPEPETRIKNTTIVLGPGTSLIAGIAYTNPGPISVTGKLKRIRVKFTDPPEDQDLRLQVFVNGVAILAAPGITVVDGSSAEVVVTEFVAAAIYGYAGQYVTFSVSYHVTGPDPVAARNGTATLEWET